MLLKRIAVRYTCWSKQLTVAGDPNGNSAPVFSPCREDRMPIADASSHRNVRCGGGHLKRFAGLDAFGSPDRLPT